MHPPLTRAARRLTSLAALPILAVPLVACSDPPDADPSGQAGEPLTALPTVDVWTIVQVADFNGDGMQDALWNNADHSEMAVWLLRGTELLEEGTRIPGPAAGPEWATITAADFNLDGMADVPWYHAPSNRFAVWLMRGTQLLSMGPEIAGPAGGGWAAANAGDLDGDGIADVLWYDEASRRMAVWLMRGTGVSEVGPEIVGPAGSGWSVITIADFNLDGMGDILWYHATTGGMAVWLMRGTEVLERGPEIPGPGSGWTLVTAADFDGDGIADLLWNDTATNRLAVWPMRGTCPVERGPVLPGPGGDGWVAASAGDTDGDGLADVVWQNLRTHGMAIWRMRGTGVLTPGAEIPGPR